LDAMKRFYVDLLGFGVEWEPDPDNIYLSSGTDNLALHRSPGKPVEGAETGRLDHIGVIVRQPSEVDQWAAFLESQGVEIAAKPKPHRDGARSCSLHDPDGNTVQIIHHPPISGKI